ncbi:mRNA export factor Gle1 [Leptidea sinapis]|uniref:mRNA export factor Gle1 n=1 Tax=Leptidea sinapis TaxID=189913 RepID=UPI0021306E79|nr:mRNA export factor Gle1 [Leptidea sinapis]
MDNYSYSSFEDLTPRKTNTKKGDISISEALVGFEKLRISALTKAATISPLVKEVTIGPKSPLKKDNIVVTKHFEPFEDTVNLLQDKIGEDLRYTLLLKEYESKLQESSTELFKNLVENMIANHADATQRYWKKQSDDSKRKTLDLRSKKIQLIKQFKENDNMSVLEKVKLDDNKCKIINRQTIENMNKILEEQNKASIRFTSITASHTKICICFNEIMLTLQSDPLGKDILGRYLDMINNIISSMSAIMDFCKTGEITDNEVNKSNTLSQNIENIYQKVLEDIEYAKKEDEKQKELEEIVRIQEEEKKKQEQALALTSQGKKTAPLFYTEKNYNAFTDLQNFLMDYENKYKELLENSNLKKFRFDCQKAVNTPVNTLSSVSGSHMKKTLEKLANLLRGEKVQISDSYVSASQHPQGINYCTALLARKIVRQGDLLVSSNSEAAFPLAAVTTVLCVEFPDFQKLLLANFHMQCPYLVPMFLPQREGQTDKEFYLSRGYTYNDEGVVEKQDKFLKRMSGVFQLMCAIWIAKPPSFIRATNPLGIKCGWQWLASFINLKPEPEICATLLHDFFNICGFEFYKYYGKQFTKVIKLISTDYLKILQNIDEGGPKTRLEVFLQNVLHTGQIPPPNGLLPQNCW